MKVKALISFAGKASMYKGEERAISNEVAAPLLKAGYIEAVPELIQRDLIPGVNAKEAGNSGAVATNKRGKKKATGNEN